MSAVISACGAYRYRLERSVQLEGPVIGYIGINPSTADASIDDATVRKWRGFTTTYGGSRFIVGNVFAYRTTAVRDLFNDPQRAFSLENRKHHLVIAADADILVPCWGNRGKVHRDLLHMFDKVLRLLQQTGKPVRCFGLTKSGDPRHPLMLGYATKLIDWRLR